MQNGKKQYNLNVLLKDFDFAEGNFVDAIYH
jgi:hypothetical protein